MTDLHLKHWPPGTPRQIEVPRQSVARNLIDTAERLPDQTAVIYYGARHSYAAMLRDARAVAGWLRHMGVKRGDRVVIDMQNCPQWMIAYYGIHLADAVVVPVNPMYRKAELEHIVRDTEARIAVVGSELVEQVAPLLESGDLDHLLVAAYADMAGAEGRQDLPEALAGLSDTDIDRPQTTRWRDALAASHPAGPHEAGADDLAVLLYTSGTTGLPKGCIHPHRTVQQVIWTYKHFSYYDDSVVQLSALPMFHVTGMQNGMNAPFCAGSTVVLMTRWDRALAGRWVGEHKVNVFRSITTMVIDLMNAPEFDSFVLSSLKLIGAGGAAVPKGVAQKLKDITGLEIVEGYGMSESIGVTHINPPQRPMQQCLGIPMYDVDCRVIDMETGAELGPDQPGEIVMHAPQIMEGYWRNPEATAEAFMQIDGKRFYKTGDVGLYDTDGYYFMTDRAKRMINASGFKVWPAEVEAMMHRHPDIAEACVIGVPDARRGESVKAFIVPRRGAALTEEALIAWCHEQMAAFKCPREIAFTDALPRNGAGKVMWRDLAAAEADRKAG
ncbi:long-chain fatty acid--CoA ligase [Oceanicola sp. 22II-s10i]|uniref:long-chain-fatty-acid--CoA ligase n=1 Tax=Oceanicola sp. 22II-s10i TaxID=1317116 RepID=UPI000B522DED|nr:long-chain-fatty-acid--CoA ligase [Oceanicola sp. 22II-s10i]OWU86564.1 long-chain fatty acid--CoA ligase [Oceanicola sp. 22II-s10i]